MSTEPTPVETVLAEVLAAHQTTRTVMGGWTTRNGKESDRRYGWRCACGAHSPDWFKVDLTASEADAGRFGHVAEVISAGGWVSPEDVQMVIDQIADATQAIVNRAEASEAKVARVEALAARLGTRPTILATQGHAQLQIIAALADPERDHVAEADELRKQRKG